VIIGILAAITIVAYNGIQQRARVASLQSDLKNAATTLEAANVTDGAYPADLSSAKLKASAGTIFQYSVDNNASPAAYCVTATIGTVSYYIDNTSHTAPTSGGCPGDGVGGVAAITNLATNPSFETGLDGAATFASTNTNPSTSAFKGSKVLRDTRNNTSGNTGPWWDAALVSGGTTYRVQLAVRSNVPSNRKLAVEWKADDGSSAGPGGTIATVATKTEWQVIGGVVTSPVGAVTRMRLTLYTVDAGSVSDYVDIDGVIVTQGSGAYSFADGSSPGWKWNGTPNESTSTGPPL
jgi:Tfp pilus assembly protein PilE